MAVPHGANEFQSPTWRPLALAGLVPQCVGPISLCYGPWCAAHCVCAEGDDGEGLDAAAALQAAAAAAKAAGIAGAGSRAAGAAGASKASTDAFLAAMLRAEQAHERHAAAAGGGREAGGLEQMLARSQAAKPSHVSCSHKQAVMNAMTSRWWCWK